MPVPLERSREFGPVQVDSDERIRTFHAKPW